MTEVEGAGNKDDGGCGEDETVIIVMQMVMRQVVGGRIRG